MKVVIRRGKVCIESVTVYEIVEGKIYFFVVQLKKGWEVEHAGGPPGFLAREDGDYVTVGFTTVNWELLEQLKGAWLRHDVREDKYKTFVDIAFKGDWITFKRSAVRRVIGFLVSPELVRNRRKISAEIIVEEVDEDEKFSEMLGGDSPGGDNISRAEEV